MPRFGRGRISSRLPASVSGGGGTTVVGIPDGAALMTDAFTATIKAVVAETNAAETDTFTGKFTGTVTESNATPTDAVKAGLSGPGLAESNPAPADSFGIRAVFNASTTFTVPTGVTSMTMECWGTGRGGLVGTATAGGAGGAGGDYCRSVVVVTPGESLTITVGPTTAVGAVGTASGVQRGGTTLVAAKGGGQTFTNVGTVQFAGGGSKTGTNLGAGGGGSGAAGTTTNGAVGGTPPAAGTGGALDGGNGGAGGASGAAGSAGAAPGGGGGGGGYSLTSPGAGSAGAAGRVRLAWTAA